MTSQPLAGYRCSKVLSQRASARSVKAPPHLDRGLPKGSIAARTADPAARCAAPPVPGECCERGCERCVWDYYRLAQARYAEADAAWQAQHGDPADGEVQRVGMP